MLHTTSISSKSGFITPFDVALDALCFALRGGHEHGKITIAAITAADSHLVHAIHQSSHSLHCLGWLAIASVVDDDDDDDWRKAGKKKKKL